MDPLQQAPISSSIPPITPPPPLHSSSKKMSPRLIVAILVLIVVLIFTIMIIRGFKKTNLKNMSVDKAQMELVKTERENNTENFADIESDFGAEVNKAAQ